MKKYVIGIDVGGTFVKLAVVDRKGKVRKRSVVSTKKHKSRNALISAMANAVKKLIEEAGLKKRDIAGIGIGVPGPVDSDKGIVYSLTNVPDWKNVKVSEIFRKKLGLPCIVDNDANAMGLGEFLFGAGKGSCNMVCVTLGTGVGGGIIINRKIYRGSSFVAGEIGHIPINEKGSLCNCGGRACVERYVGNKYIVQEAINRIHSGERTRALEMAGGKIRSITPEILDRAARKGDKLAKEVWKDVGRHLGIMLSGVINLLNPDKVVIGGGVAKAGILIFDSLRRTIRERAMYIHARDCKVVAAKLGDDAGAIGAAALVWGLSPKGQP